MQSVAQFNGSIPAVYDQELGPFLFDWSAKALGERVRAPLGGLVLELACGTGISTEGLRHALPLDAEIIATDLNDAMLAEARSRRGDLEGVSYQVADAQVLPFEDDTFDVIVCQFGIMFFPDPVGALREALRVLRPGGQLLFSVWDTLDRNPPVEAVHPVFAQLFPEDPPRFLETPFGLYGESELAALFDAAGARDVETESVDHVVELPSARGPAKGLVCGSPAVLELEAREGVSLDAVVDAAEAAIADRCGASPWRAPLRAIFVSAQK